MMASRRSLATIDTLNLRGFRLRPSYRHISHDEPVDFKPPPQLVSPSHFLRAAAYSSTANAAVSRFRASSFVSFAATPFGFGFPHCNPRWISSSSAERSLASEIVDEVVGQSTLDVASQIPDLSEVTIAAANSAYPVAALQHLIENVHLFTGLNWWAAIALTTVLLEVAMLPIFISIKSYGVFKPVDSQLVKDFNRILSDPDTTVPTKISRFILRLKQHAVNPHLILIAVATNATINLSFIFAMINMAESVPSFHTGGALWFVDLTTEAYVLAFVNAFIWGIWHKIMHPLAKQLGVEIYISATTRFMVPVMIGFPQAMYIHWITSHICGACFYLALRKHVVKKLPDTPEVPDAPPSTEKESKNSDKDGN